MQIKQHFHVLIVEDNQVDADILKRYLLQSKLFKFNIYIAGTLAKAKKILNSRIIDVILLDLNLPDSSGQSTFDTIAATHANVPTLIVSGIADISIAVKTVAAGAQEYLMKDRLSVESLESVFSKLQYRDKARKFVADANQQVPAKPAVTQAYSSDLVDSYKKVICDLETADYRENDDFHQSINNFADLFQQEDLSPHDLENLKHYQTIVDTSDQVLLRLNTYIVSSLLENMLKGSSEVFDSLGALGD